MEPPLPATGGTVPILLGSALVLALVLANAFFVAAEFALVGARPSRLEDLSRSGDRKATLALRAVQSLDKYISATQLGITLASLGLGWIGEPALAHFFDGIFEQLGVSLDPVASHGIAVAVAFGIITLLHIILGELVPKAVALLYPETVSMWAVPPLLAFAWVMAVPIRVLNGTANWLLRLSGLSVPGEHERLHSPEEIRMLVEQSTEGGSLGKEDARLLEGVFEFSEKNAEDVMTPRTQMFALERSLSAPAAADAVAASGRSRYPVHTGSIDEIVGVVHAKDILSALRTRPDATVGDLMRAPLFVPGTREVEDVLADMKRLKVHLAVVLDEYGGTAGLVTMEDLLEEIVGPIFDEHDLPDVVVPGGEAVTLDGSTPISEFNTAWDTEIPDDDYTTLGGFLFGQLGRLPVVGDRIPVAGRVFEIVAMEGRRVQRVRLLDQQPA